MRWITKKSDDYDEKYIKIKFSPDDELPLNKTTKILSIIIVVRANWSYKWKKVVLQIGLIIILQESELIHIILHL